MIESRVQHSDILPKEVRPRLVLKFRPKAKLEGGPEIVALVGQIKMGALALCAQCQTAVFMTPSDTALREPSSVMADQRLWEHSWAHLRSEGWKRAANLFYCPACVAGPLPEEHFDG